MLERVEKELGDPFWVIEMYEEYRTGGMDTLPPKFLDGTEGICRAVVVVLYACDVLGIETCVVDEGVVEEMRLDPIIRRFGDIETLFGLCHELICEV